MRRPGRPLNIIAALLALAIAAPAAAQIPPGYYDSVDDTNATTLRATLATRLRTGFDNVGYSNSWAPIKRVWQDPLNSNNVILIYTGDSRPKADQCGGACEDGSYLTGAWSREHIWPQSSFNSTEPMRSDLHALFPCDQDLNNRRGNKPFNDVATNQLPLPANGCEDNSQFFEPRPADRGDVARALLYMDVRYEGTFGEPNLVLNDAPGSSGSFQMGILSTLLRWHCEDPPDAFEIARNNRVYNEQGNANPFIDNPHWVGILYGFGNGTDGDTLTVTPSNASTATMTPGSEAPFLRIAATASSNEWVLQALDITQTGTIADAQVSAIRLYNDADNSGTVTPGDVLLGTTTLSGGTGTIVSNGFSIGPTTTRLLVTARITGGATVGSTVQLRLDANSMEHSPCGGADIDPTFAAFTSGATNVISGGGPPGSVIISEIMYNPDSSEAAPVKTEWIELYNTGATPITLTDARIVDDDGQTGQFTVTLAGNEAVVIAPAEVLESEFRAAWPGSYQLIRVTGWGSGGLNNLTNSPPEPVTLRDASGQILDAVTYDDVAPWPVLSPDGPSIYVLPAFLNSIDNDNGANWAASVVGVDGAVADVGPAPFNGIDIGSPGTVVSSGGGPTGVPVIGVCSNAIEDTPGNLVLSFTDSDDAAANTFTVTSSAVTAGTLGTSGVVAKVGTGAYTATFTYVPAPDQFGNESFQVSIDDGVNPAVVGTVNFTVEPVNDAPTITPIGDQTIAIGGSTGALPFTVGDIDSDVNAIVLSAQVEDPLLLPPDDIVFGGAGASRTVTVAGAPGLSGVSEVTIYVEDAEGGVEATSFTVTVVGLTSAGDSWILYQ